MYLASGIATLMGILGPAAPLTQTFYLDRAQAPLDRVPFVGKIMADVPALAFVFDGFTLAVYGIKQYAHKVVK